MSQYGSTAPEYRQSGFKQPLEVGVVQHHKLAFYVVLPVDPDGVGQFAIHLALVDGVVEYVEDYGVTAIRGIFQDPCEGKGNLCSRLYCQFLMDCRAVTRSSE